MILAPAACACLTVIAGCGDGASDNAQPAAASSAAFSSAPPQPQGSTAVSPAVGSPAGSPGGGPAGLTATLNMRDGQGDSYTQTFAFGSPEPESDAPDAVSGMQTCELGVAIPARNLVVPVQITTTLTTSVQTEIPVGVSVAQYSAADSNAGLPGDIVYKTTSGDLCATDTTGADVTLTEGQSATTQAWIVLQDAITPAYPDGDTAQLSNNFVYIGVSQGEVTSAQGSAVCTGDSQTQESYSPPYLVFAGTAPSGEGCGGTYSGSSS
jgi:hypothetical protein